MKPTPKKAMTVLRRLYKVSAFKEFYGAVDISDGA
jgi:hypothetical protein